MTPLLCTLVGVSIGSSVTVIAIVLTYLIGEKK